jgi:hypothetical protein
MQWLSLCGQATCFQLQQGHLHVKIQNHKQYVTKTTAERHRVAKNNNTLLLFFNSCVLTSPVTPYSYWQCCLSVRHTLQLHGGSRPPSHVYPVTNCSHVAHRTQTTKSCIPSRTVRCRSGGWDSRSALRGTGEVVIVCMCKRSSTVCVRSQMNQVNVLPPNNINIIHPITNDPRTGFVYSHFLLQFCIHISPSPSSTEFVLPTKVKQ